MKVMEVTETTNELVKVVETSGVEAQTATTLIAYNVPHLVVRLPLEAQNYQLN